MSDPTSERRYTLETLIGRGGMGEVWLGRSHLEEGLSRVVAIKRTIPSQAHDPRAREQFLTEARASLGLRHPNIVYVFDFLKIDERDCLVMEWVDGVNAADLMEDLRQHGPWPVPLPVCIYIAVSILRALDYTHGLKGVSGSGLIHRDVSPQNILISRLGEVKLSDFGVARLTDAATTLGGPKGKIAYMAPEQFYLRYDERVDLYSVGAVLFEMLCGVRYQFEGGEKGQEREGTAIVQAVAAQGYSEQLGEAVARLLRQKPQDRYPDAKEALHSLRAFQPISEREAQERLRGFIGRASAMVRETRGAQDAGAKDSKEISSLVAHQLLDDTRRTMESPTAEDSVPPAAVQQETQKDAPNESARWSLGWSSLLSWALGASAVGGLAWFGLQGFEFSNGLSSRAHDKEAKVEFVGDESGDSTEESSKSVETGPKRRLDEFAQALSRARNTSIGMMSELLDKEEPLQPEQREGLPLASLVAFNLRLVDEDEAKLRSGWISSCGTGSESGDPSPTVPSCQAALALLPKTLVDEFPATLRLQGPADTQGKIVPVLSRALDLLSSQEGDRARVRVNELLQSMAWEPKQFSVNANRFSVGGVRLLSAGDSMVSGSFTRQGWYSGVGQALCDESRSELRPEWLRRLTELPVSVRARVEKHGAIHPSLTAYTQLRNEAWSRFLGSLKTVAPRKLEELRIILGADSGGKENFAKHWIETLAHEGRLDLTLCEHWAGLDQDADFAKTLQSERARLFLKEQSQLLAWLDTSRREPEKRDEAIRVVKKILESSRPPVEGPLWTILRAPAQFTLQRIVKSKPVGIRERWCSEVYAPFRQGLASRYPFKKSAKGEVSLRTLGRFFHPSRGTLWRFVAQNKEWIVREKGRFTFTARAKQEGQALSPAALDFLEQAWLLARALYPDGGAQARVAFSVELPGNQKNAKIQWETGSGPFSLGAGRSAPKKLIWPVDFGRGATELTFYQRTDGGGDRPEWKVSGAAGSWSLFRLLDKGFVFSDRGRQFTMVWANKTRTSQTRLRFRMLREPSLFFGYAGQRTRFLEVFSLAATERPVLALPRC